MKRNIAKKKMTETRVETIQKRQEKIYPFVVVWWKSKGINWKITSILSWGNLDKKMLNQ